MIKEYKFASASPDGNTMPIRGASDCLEYINSIKEAVAILIARFYYDKGVGEREQLIKDFTDLHFKTHELLYNKSLHHSVRSIALSYSRFLDSLKVQYSHLFV